MLCSETYHTENCAFTDWELRQAKIANSNKEKITSPVHTRESEKNQPCVWQH
jgi:hypothetical protein